MTIAHPDDPQRFRDPRNRLGRFADEILVRCPVCDGQASVIPDPTIAGDPGQSRFHRRLSCLRCGHTDTWTAPRDGNARTTPALSGPDDPYFRLPLWLRANCCGDHVLWAYNTEHLDLLEAYLVARLRERGDVPGSMSMVERLPAWLKSAKHRDEALRTIRRLRATLNTP
jgi:hypothetical protein